jgi:hypothetical protein
MSNNRVDPKLAAEMDAKLWEYARKKSIRDKDLSAVLDVLKHYAVSNYMIPAHLEVATSILAKPTYTEPTNPTVHMPLVPTDKPLRSTNESAMDDLAETRNENAETLLRRLSAAGMLRGKKGNTAMELLTKADRWSASQSDFAKSLSKEIRDSALVYVALKEITESSYGSGSRFAESLVESFDEWGCYTARQLEAARDMVIRDAGSDPLEAVVKPTQTSPMQTPTTGPRIAPPKKAGPIDDNDIPF